MTRKVLRGESGHLKVAATSFFRRILVGMICLLVAVCLHAPVALAQHGGGAHAGGGFGGGHFGGGGGHFGGGGHSGGGHSAGGAHASAPRGAAPAPKPPAATSGIHPSTFAPRTTILPPATRSFNGGNAGFNPGITGNLRPRPVPHPVPPPVSIIYIPVYYSPFFYGGFNSFWGCDPFWGFGGCYSPFGFGYGGFGYGGGWGYGGYGGYYGGLYNGWGWGNYGGVYNGWGNYSSAGAAEQDTTPQTYVAPSYPTDTRTRELVELFFKDGTVFNVIDYWLVDGQLHFLTVNERGESTVEHVLPFDSLDVQKSTDVNTDRGFKFQLRNESMEQYLRNHPEAEPKVDPDAPHNQ